MPVDFYYHPLSPPCRVVILVAKHIGVDLNHKKLDVLNGEQLKDDFVKLNPQHSVPTIDDNGFVLWESRAIITYLQNQYGKDDSLYPKVPKERAVVDQRLFFDMDMHSRIHEVYNRETLTGGAVANPEKIVNANKSLEFLNTFLGQTEYVAGDNLTLADLSILIQISALVVVKHDLSPYNNILRWYNKLKATLPGYVQFEEEQFAMFKEIFERIKKPA